MQWERRILWSNGTVLKVILLSTFLVMTWGSFSSLRCHAWTFKRSATKRQLCREFLSAPKPRLVRYLEQWQRSDSSVELLTTGSGSFFTALASVLEMSGLPEVDFLLPLVDDNGPVYLFQPMDYAIVSFYFQQPI